MSGRLSTVSSTLIPAATVVLTRVGDGGPEVLMVRRDSRLAFAGGMWVFPGGRIDPEDFSGDPDDLSAAEARAAAREAAEEVGLEVDPSSLVRWSHWTPPDHGQSHRFSTAFFVGPAPAGEVVIDDGEIRAHRWVTAADAIELHRHGEIELSPPTFITLVQLAEAADVAAVLAGRPGDVEHFATRIAGDGDDLVALYHGDAGYESSDPTVPGRRHRLVMADGGWAYLRDP
jgi:8-oxo-dGTP pyrophosphatase MutT (NUDIX family)